MHGINNKTFLCTICLTKLSTPLRVLIHNTHNLYVHKYNLYVYIVHINWNT